ncbi:hypothetical protein CCHL11_10302 [Colletotrichum chlorophyti]|uniref:Uncharacterized protein n=1 Tax=Colletotrichum chlorophyti TaxID=708187 RepID=A0A1Q8RAY2_9PEZI|nr:hypothetical protein CCHL11_10302 [Colletotrichum chlorophyti]
MYSKTLLLTLLAPLVAAHGNVQVVTGDQGGNTTALGIQGGIVPGPGPNKVTEVDTTQFRSTNILSNGLGKTTGGGRNTPEKIVQAMALSGDTLPQVSNDGTGKISGTYHIVTTDGAGPVKCALDVTGTGNFENAILLDTTQQVPGKGGNIRPNGQVPNRGRSIVLKVRSLFKRAQNVNKDFAFECAVPDMKGQTCQGTMGGKTDACLVKVANANRAGPFGGVFAIQLVPGAGKTATIPADTAPATPAKPAKRAVEFTV